MFHSNCTLLDNILINALAPFIGGLQQSQKRLHYNQSKMLKKNREDRQPTGAVC